MDRYNTKFSTRTKKSIIIIILFASTYAIMFLGIYFSAFSFLNGISFQILNSSVQGTAFGLLVLYLGIRYYFLVAKLKAEIYEEKYKFSWNNFKSKKSNKKSRRNNL